jgi:hypothetical protein
MSLIIDYSFADGIINGLVKGCSFLFTMFVLIKLMSFTWRVIFQNE